MAKQLTTPGQASAARTPGLTPFHTLTRIEFRRAAVTRTMAALLLIATPLVYGWLQMSRTISRDHLDVYFEFFTSPIILVLPVFAVLLGSTSLFSDLGHRFVANTRTRASVRIYLAAKLVGGGGIAFLVFFAAAFATFVAAFWVWPALGDFHVDPSAYNMTELEATQDAQVRTTFSQLLAVSEPAFGITYASWFGLCGFVYASLTDLLLVLLPNRAVAVVLPLVVYLAETVIAALLGIPLAGLLYSAVPFGMAQTSVVEGTLPTLILLAVVAAGWAVVFADAKTLRRLS